jgi:hypothetical protein
MQLTSATATGRCSERHRHKVASVKGITMAPRQALILWPKART